MTPRTAQKRAAQPAADPQMDGEFIPEPGGKYRMMVVIPHSSRLDIDRAKDLLNTTPSSIVHQAVVWFVRHHPLLLLLMREEEERLSIDDALGTVQKMVSEAKAGKTISVERLAELESMLTITSNLKREATT